MLEENLTDIYIEEKIKNGLCGRLAGDYRFFCDLLVDLTPYIIKSIGSKSTASNVCIDLGLCSKPFDHYNTTFGDMPTFEIDLDLPPVQRWTHVCSLPKYSLGWQDVIKILTGGLPDKGAGIAALGRLVNTFMTTEYAQEIQGCASALGVDYGFVTFMQLGYEVSDACTSIVAQNPQGDVIHVRNLDFWDGITLTDQLKAIAGIYDFRKAGKSAFRISGFVGYMGALSGQVPGGFSVTIDTRFYPNGLWEMFDEIIFALEHTNASLVSFLTRTTLETKYNFTEAVKFLKNYPLVADVYYTVAGSNPGEGIVIARNRTDTANTTVINLNENKWYVLITNYDWWKPQPWFDDRYWPAVEALGKMGYQNCTMDGLIQVMTTKPILNLQTTYTFISIPRNTTYQTYIRFCNFPCVQ
jgi:hypothetical protein